MQRIKEHFGKQKHAKVHKVKLVNILIVGRTRTGKSTVKGILIDPTNVPSEMTILSDTREATFESFMIEDLGLVVNIIDTPGVFEYCDQEDLIRSNEVILRAIEKCINHEITKFHLVCFAFSMTAGIQTDDIKALELFKNFLGPAVAKNACLIKDSFKNELYYLFLKINRDQEMMKNSEHLRNTL
jgi:GTPase Era involved in 16S rRNA processing